MRERDFERFLTFVDAVVAIAITLLVLPLVDIAGEIEAGQSAADLIGDHAAAIGSALLSFAVIARLWLLQHHTLRDVVAEDRVIIELMLLWLLLIALLPFPTALLPETGDEPLTKILYMGTIAASCFCLAAVGRHLDRAGVIRGSGGAGLTILVALAISLVIPAAGYWPLLLLLVADRVFDRVAS